MSARVRFVPLGIDGEAHESETILDVARRVSAPVGNSCGGTGICRRCKVIVLDGAESLTPRTWIEEQSEDDAPLQDAERLACQATPKGDVSVTTSYWGYRRD